MKRAIFSVVVLVVAANVMVAPASATMSNASDLTTYTEDDPNNIITVNGPDSLDATGITSNSDALLYKPTNGVANETQVRFSFTQTAHSNYGQYYVGFSNAEGKTTDSYDSYLAGVKIGSASGNNDLNAFVGQPTDTSTVNQLDTGIQGTQYYVEMTYDHVNGKMTVTAWTGGYGGTQVGQTTMSFDASQADKALYPVLTRGASFTTEGNMDVTYHDWQHTSSDTKEFFDGFEQYSDGDNLGSNGWDVSSTSADVTDVSSYTGGQSASVTSGDGSGYFRPSEQPYAVNTTKNFSVAVRIRSISDDNADPHIYFRDANGDALGHLSVRDLSGVTEKEWVYITIHDVTGSSFKYTYSTPEGDGGTVSEPWEYADNVQGYAEVQIKATHDSAYTGEIYVDDYSVGHTAPDNVTITAGSQNLSWGETTTYDVTKTVDGTTTTVTDSEYTSVTSNDTSVISVDETNNELVAEGEGTAKITASHNGTEDVIIVEGPDPDNLDSPQVSTGSADPSSGSAVLNGEASIDQYDEVEVYFRYGTGSDLNQTTSKKTLTSSGTFSITATGLAPLTDYNYEAVVVSTKSGDQATGTVETFETGLDGLRLEAEEFLATDSTGTYEVYATADNGRESLVTQSASAESSSTGVFAVVGPGELETRNEGTAELSVWIEEDGQRYEDNQTIEVSASYPTTSWEVLAENTEYSDFGAFTRGNESWYVAANAPDKGEVILEVADNGTVVSVHDFDYFEPNSLAWAHDTNTLYGLSKEGGSVQRYNLDTDDHTQIYSIGSSDLSWGTNAYVEELEWANGYLGFYDGPDATFVVYDTSSQSVADNSFVYSGPTTITWTGEEFYSAGTTQYGESSIYQLTWDGSSLSSNLLTGSNVTAQPETIDVTKEGHLWIGSANGNVSFVDRDINQVTTKYQHNVTVTDIHGTGSEVDAVYVADDTGNITKYDEAKDWNGTEVFGDGDSWADPINVYSDDTRDWKLTSEGGKTRVSAYKTDLVYTTGTEFKSVTVLAKPSSLEINIQNQVPKNSTTPYSITVTYADGTTANVTSTADMVSSDPAILFVLSGAQVETYDVNGTVTLTATYEENGITLETQKTVDVETLMNWQSYEDQPYYFQFLIAFTDWTFIFILLAGGSMALLSRYTSKDVAMAGFGMLMTGGWLVGFVPVWLLMVLAVLAVFIVFMRQQLGPTFR